ncbi:MAG: heat-inducible transcription repressor HrcA [Deltaproteobacteria bacterium]|nr:heat-inducible transcription repressor HrcA [Deltaproteobacteria bacterium]
MTAVRLTAELTDRQREVLQAVVEHYIATAEPVGSRSLTRANRGIDVSPATVRNTMADLEDLGYLSAPHSSAGRIPTALAFRVFVEQLAQRGRISPKERELITTVTSHADRDIRQVLAEAGRILATVSKHASLVLLPSIEEVVFSDIEFLPVRDRTILCVFVAKSGLVQHRTIDVDFPVEREELRRMSNYLKSLLDGQRLVDVRDTILTAMRDERAQADEVMRRALALGERSLTVDRAPIVLIEGERALFEQPEFADITRMRRILRAFEEKTMLLRLLDASIAQPQAAAQSDTHVLFGADAPVNEFKDLAVVMASYATEDGPVGTLGVVGPIRMDYSRVIPLVELTAGTVARSLSGKEPAEDGQPGSQSD